MPPWRHTKLRKVRKDYIPHNISPGRATFFKSPCACDVLRLAYALLPVLSEAAGPPAEVIGAGGSRPASPVSFSLPRFTGVSERWALAPGTIQEARSRSFD